MKNLVVEEAGYVYIYLSNEGETPVDVFFDDFRVEQVKGPVVQVEEYYPFGLVFNGCQRESSLKNRYLYNQGFGDKIFNTERVFDLELNIDLSRYRAYDPAISRWWQVDPLADQGQLVSHTPYDYAFSNPVRYNDPEGDCPLCAVPIVLEGSAILLEAAGFAAAGATLATFGDEIYNGVSSWFASDGKSTVTLPNGKDIALPGHGRGSVPPEDRDSRRGATTKTKQEMFDERGEKCEGCDQSKELDEVDAHHVKRHADGGATEKENLVNLCKDCHGLVHKTAKEEYHKQKQQQQKDQNQQEPKKSNEPKQQQEQNQRTNNNNRATQDE